MATVRIVCSFVGGAGHLVPQLPLHRALARAGHELTLLGRSSAVGSAGPLYREVVPRPDRRSAVTDSIAPIAPIDIEGELAVVERHFAGAAARDSAARVAPQLDGAGLLVCDELDFGAMAAAQRAGTPVVVVAVIASGALVRPARLRTALAALQRDLGATEPVRPFGDVFVVPFEPSMRAPGRPAPSNTLWMRPDPGGEPAPDGSIVATLGTEFNTESGDLFDRILLALAATGAPATLAIGRDLDPARFSAQPAHVRVERFVDLDALLPRASVVIHHGGSGLFVRSVLASAPQLVFPMGADQPFTAERVEQLRIGEVLDAAATDPESIAQSLDRLLSAHDQRSQVAALRARTLALPSPDSVAERILARFG